MVLAQTAHDILHVQNHIVDDDGDGNQQPRQHHHVHRRPAQVEHEPCHHQRQWDHYHADQRDTPVVKKGEKDEHYEKKADEQRPGKVAHRHIDEVRWPENIGVDLYTGKAGLQLSELCFDPPRHILWVGTWELLDDEQEAGTVVGENIVPDERLMIFHYRGHVTQAQRRILDIHLGEVLW